MDTAIVITTPQGEKIKERLQQSIQRKRQVLTQWMEKAETLRMELELIKNEYTVRIGYLLLKDNQLDLEIIQYKNLKKRMDEGMTYEEAVKAEEDTFYNEILRMQLEQERIEEEKSFFEKRQDVPDEVQEDIKTLWKKLIRKFHPDLVTNEDEKAKREEVMKQVNKAYAEADLETLQQLENRMEVENIEESTVVRLEIVLVQTENLITQIKQEFKNLRESEWYGWKKRKEKGEKQHNDIFADLEKGLLDDVVKKIAILRELRKEINPQIVI